MSTSDMQAMETLNQIQERLNSSSMATSTSRISSLDEDVDLSAVTQFLEAQTQSSDQEPPSFALLKSMARLLADAFVRLAKSGHGSSNSKSILELLQVSTMPIKASKNGKSSNILMFCGKKRLAQILTCLVKMDFIPPSKWVFAFLLATERAFFKDQAADRNNSILLSEVLLPLAVVGVRIPSAWLDSALNAVSLHALGGVMRSGEVAMALWALARLGYRPEDTSSLMHLVPLVFKPSANASIVAPPLSCKELSALLFALERLRFVPDRAWLKTFLQRIQQVASEEPSLSSLSSSSPSSLAIPPCDISGLMISLARLDMRISRARYQESKKDLPPSSSSPPTKKNKNPPLPRPPTTSRDRYYYWFRSTWIPHMARALIGRQGRQSPSIASYETRDIANILWACGKLKLRPHAAWLDAAIKSFAFKVPERGHEGTRFDHASSQDIARLLSGLSNLHKLTGHVSLSISWINSLETATRSKLCDYAPRDLVTILHSLSELHVTPGLLWMISYAKAVGSGGQAGMEEMERSSAGLAAFNFLQIQLIHRGLQYQMAQDRACTSSAKLITLAKDVEVAWMAGHMGYKSGQKDFEQQQGSRFENNRD